MVRKTQVPYKSNTRIYLLTCTANNILLIWTGVLYREKKIKLCCKVLSRFLCDDYDGEQIASARPYHSRHSSSWTVFLPRPIGLCSIRGINTLQQQQHTSATTQQESLHLSLIVLQVTPVQKPRRWTGSNNATGHSTSAATPVIPASTHSPTPAQDTGRETQRHCTVLSF